MCCCAAGPGAFLAFGSNYHVVYSSCWAFVVHYGQPWAQGYNRCVSGARKNRDRQLGHGPVAVTVTATATVRVSSSSTVLLYEEAVRRVWET